MANKSDSIPKELVSKVPVFDSRMPITKVIPAIQKSEAVLINKQGTFYGVIDTRAIYKSGMRLKISKDMSAERFAVRVPKVFQSTSINDLISYFYKIQAKALPFVSDGKIMGVIKRSTLLKMMLSLSLVENDVQAGSIMTSPILAIASDANLSQAKAAMEKNKVKRLVVLDNGKFSGLLTHSDMVMKYASTNERAPEIRKNIYNPSNISISGIYNKDPVVINADASIKDAIRRMIERSISSLIIMRHNAPVGILTVSDILEYLISQRGIEENRILLSGFDEKTYQYMGEVRDSVKEFLSKTEKIRGADINYISIRVRPIKSDQYEIKIRASLKSFGTLQVHETDFLLDRTLAETLEKLKKEIIRLKEKRNAYEHYKDVL
jgi:predicted transcriptional regulator